MSSFDFGALRRPSTGSRPTNPIEIFRSAPALAGSVNDLWQGQSKALEQWAAARTQRDTLVSLHTGAGKTIVGLLIAQSLVNEGLGKVLYLCATNDLVQQTSKEVKTKLGFTHSTRMGGSFSNDSYVTGQGFCLTNYQALFNGRSIFAADLRPDAILFDDAHVSEKLVRDCYTIRISSETHSELFARIVRLLAPHFAAVHREDYFRGIVAGESNYRVALVPPGAMVSLVASQNLLGILRDHDLHKGDAGFALEHLADHLVACTMFISKSQIEIAPAFLPTKRIPFLNDNEIRRVYLSATLTSEVDFVRAFGKQPAMKIEPESDAGMGERLIVLADRDVLADGQTEGVKDERIAALLSARHKVLISTSSYASAGKYRAVAQPPGTAEFSQKLEEFRQRVGPGAFILVGRIDGIDLPHSTCRVMLADGLPLGLSLYENFLFDFLEMRNSLAAKMANRITQLFGRTNRGRNDYSVIFVSDKRFKAWLSTPRNVALLPELLRKQIGLGQSLVAQFKIDDVNRFADLAQQVVDRDAGWLSYYSDSILGRDVDEVHRVQAADTDKNLTQAALKEADFAAAMWDGNTRGARTAFEGIVDQIVVADRRLAGWYNIQVGHTYELERDPEAAAKQYAQARARTNHVLPLPIPATSASAAMEQSPKNRLHRQLIGMFSNDVRLQNDHIDRQRRLIEPLFDANKSSSQHEESMRALGELLGFDASRPEQESEEPSTLDVMWENERSKEAILIELKTKKGSNGTLNMDDIGQGLQQIAWAQSNPERRVLGHITLTNVAERSREAAPTQAMRAVDMSTVKALYDEFIEILWALQRMNPSERYAEIDSLVQRADWQPETLFKRLGQVAVADLPLR